MANPYQILGVAKGATADEIKSAYRKLAKKLHPDVNPGKKDIEQKFKEVTSAYDLLSDPQKRARFDRGELDDMGNERAYSRARGGADPFASGMRGGFGRRGGATEDFASGGFNPEDILAEFFGGGRRGGGGGQQTRAAKGEDVHYNLAVPFLEAALGEKKRLTLNNGKTVDVNIPAGSESGHKLRLRGLGNPGAEAGDAIIEIQVEPHPYFSRKDFDIVLEAPISISEALTGASIQVPTLSGQVAVKVPKHANSGATLRLKGKGVARPTGDFGDMLVKLKIVLPENVTADLTEFMENYAKKHPYDPRKKLGWS